VGGNETLQMYGIFEGFPPLIGAFFWVGNIMTPAFGSGWIAVVLRCLQPFLRWLQNDAFQGFSTGFHPLLGGSFNQKIYL